MRISIKQAEKLLANAQGVQQLVELGVGECDFLEFKRTVNRLDPKWQSELRADCAALSTVGTGFLVVGVEDSRDGRDAAAAVVGIADSVDLKTAILHTLAEGLSPPLKKRDAIIVSLDNGKDVLVVKVGGRKGYPVTIIDNPVSRRHVVREAGRKNWLSEEKARLRRQELDLQRERMWIVPLFVLLLVVSSVVVYKMATVAAVEQATRMPKRSLDPVQRRKAVEELARSPGHRVEVWEVVGDAESNLLAGQIVDALLEAGWIPERSMWMGLEAVGIFINVKPTGEGVCVLPYESTAYRLGHALKGMELGISIGCEPSLKSDIPVLVVGRHPQSHIGKMLLEGTRQPDFVDGSDYPPPP